VPDTKAIVVDVWSPQLSVKVAGTEYAVGQSGQGLLADVTVEQSNSDLDHFTLTVLNWDEVRQDRRFIARTAQQALGTAPDAQFPFGLGQLVEINMGYPTWTKNLIKGEITRVKPVFPGAGPPMLVIEGGDGLHRLMGGTRSHAYNNKTDKQIVEEVVRLANADNGSGRSTSTRALRAEVTNQPAVQEVHDHVYQFNQTDASFLKERARRLGWEVVVQGDVLYFRPPDPAAAGQNMVLEWGKTLESLELNLNLGQQPTEVEVRSWDGQRGSVITYKTTDGDLRSLVGTALSGAEARRTVFGGKPVRLTGRLVRSRAEAKAMAIAYLRRQMEDFVKVKGTTFGMPDLRPGITVTINQIDPAFAGDYYVTRCTHRFGPQGYRTEFEARRMAL
jgi:uncharacterized protein